MQAGEGGMQPIKPAEIEHAVRLARLGRHDVAAQSGKRGVAIGHDRGQPIHRTAQGHHDETAFHGAGGESEPDRPERDGGGKTEQGGAPAGFHGWGHRRWNSGAANSNASASRREPACCTALSVAGRTSGPSASAS